jgi:hypothetical protein
MALTAFGQDLEECRAAARILSAEQAEVCRRMPPGDRAEERDEHADA